MQEKSDFNYDVEVTEKISDLRRESEKYLLETSPVYKSQVAMIKSVFDEDKKGGLDQTQKLLVNLGIAVYSGKDSAIDWAMTRVLNHGGTDEMIRDVIEIAGLNGGSLSMASVRKAHNVRRHRKIKRPKS